MSRPLSRRTFLRLAGAIIPAVLVGTRSSQALARTMTPARPTMGATVLIPSEWRALGLLVDHVFPKTATSPSAQEAGVLAYLARALTDGLPGWRLRAGAGRTGGGYAHLAGHYRQVVLRLNRLARAAHRREFAALTRSEREPLVAAFAAGARADVGYNVKGVPIAGQATDSQLFELVRRHAIEGYFGEPVHGGNKDFGAWKAIGHTHHLHYPQ